MAQKWLYLYTYLMRLASLWSAVLNDSFESCYWKELRGNFAIHASKDGVSPFICVVSDDDVGGKLFFASKKEW